MPKITQPIPFSCTDKHGRFNPGVFTQLGFLSIKLQDAQDSLDKLLEHSIFDILLKDIPELTAIKSLVGDLSQLIKEGTEAQRTREAVAEAAALREH